VVALMLLAAIASGAAVWGIMRSSGLLSDNNALALSVVGPDGVSDSLRQDELDKFNKALELIGSQYLHPVSRKALIDGALQGMIEALGDPYSVYLNSEEAGKFTDDTYGTFTGIGADLKKENGMIVVESTIKDSPAQRAGLQPRDVLLMVNGESLQGLSLDEAASKIRGPKGTKAKLKVMRSGVKEPIELELVRDRIMVETVRSQMGQDKIGRMVISQFTADTARQVKEQLQTMEAGGIKALIIDLRNNPGGMTESVIKVANLFIPAGKVIVGYEYGDGRTKQELATGEMANRKSYPIVVLINQSSASAAEMLAGALKQSAGAVLVGERSFGKGTVQISFGHEMGDGSLVKLTVYKWLLPDGTSVNNHGLQPDIPVSQPDYWMAFKLPRDRVLKRDDTGDDVKNLQTILEGVGFPPDRKDGYFSEATEEALLAFQMREKLPVTGYLDSDTADRLEEVLYAVLQSPDSDWQLQAALDKARAMAGITSASGTGRNSSFAVEYVGG
jgi:carboxyl-terminal processing protease